MNTAARVRRVLRRETIGVDVLASLNLVGALLKYLSLAFALPITVALAYGESPWPFVASAAIVAGAATGLQAATRG